MFNLLILLSQSQLIWFKSANMCFHNSESENKSNSNATHGDQFHALQTINLDFDGIVFMMIVVVVTIKTLNAIQEKETSRTMWSRVSESVMCSRVL